MSMGPLYVSSPRCLFRPFDHFLIGLFAFLVLSHMNSLCILKTQTLFKVSLANMFSHMFGSLFIFLIFSLAMQKFFNLMKSYLFILSFMSLALGAILVKILLHGESPLGLLGCCMDSTIFAMNKCSTCHNFSQQKGKTKITSSYQ